MGVDLREVWNLAVDTAGFEQLGFELPEQQDEDVDAATADGADAPASESEENAGPSGEEARASTGDKEKIESEIGQLRQAIDRLSNSKGEVNAPDQAPVNAPQTRPQDTDSKSAGNSTLKKAIVGKQTLAFWHKLNAIMLKEEQMRAAPAGGLTAGNAGAFLAGRGKANRYAAQSIRGLSKKNVDPLVANLAGDIAAWYESGAKINDQATFLMTEADPSARRGPLGESWKTAERQHRMEVDLLNRRGDALREQMTAKYGVAFPDLR